MSHDVVSIHVTSPDNVLIVTTISLPVEMLPHPQPPHPPPLETH